MEMKEKRNGKNKAPNGLEEHEEGVPNGRDAGVGTMPLLVASNGMAVPMPTVQGLRAGSGAQMPMMPMAAASPTRLLPGRRSAAAAPAGEPPAKRQAAAPAAKTGPAAAAEAAYPVPSQPFTSTAPLRPLAQSAPSGAPEASLAQHHFVAPAQQSKAAGKGKAAAKGKKPTRHDSSLCVLTEKFKEIIRCSPGGIVDLHDAAERLDVRKRRIYDITNVLEGIGLIRKESKNNMQWTGDFRAQHEITTLRESVRELQAEEHRLDVEMEKQMRSLRALSEDPQQAQLAYISVDDIRALEKMQGESLIVIKAPGGTTLKVPDPFLAGEDSQSRYQIMLQSSGGPIDVWVLDSADAQPEPPTTDEALFSEYSLASGVVGDDSLLVAPGALSDPSDIYQLFPPEAGVSDYYADDAFAAAT